MQTFTESKTKVGILNINATLDATAGAKSEPAKDATVPLMIAALVSMIAVQTVKAFGLANGMDEHMRMTLSYVGLALCFISAPAILLYGRNMSIKTGLISGASLIFAVVLLASIVS